jgi:Ran GTPase-activating protein (RanGAP) involved in mRNA processing and transport
MKNKIALSVALALAMISENKAMVIENLEVKQIQYLSSLLEHPKLKALTLYHFELTAQSIETLTKNLPQDLTRLDLSWNQIGKEGSIELAKCLPRDLTHLEFKWNQIDALALANHLPLIHLDLSGNQIGNEGVRALVANPLPKTLTHLNLSWNQIGDEGALALANHFLIHQGIIYFDLRGNLITSDGRGAFTNILKAIPNLIFRLAYQRTPALAAQNLVNIAQNPVAHNEEV